MPSAVPGAVPSLTGDGGGATEAALAPAVEPPSTKAEGATAGVTDDELEELQGLAVTHQELGAAFRLNEGLARMARELRLAMREGVALRRAVDREARSAERYLHERDAAREERDRALLSTGSTAGGLGTATPAPHGTAESRSEGLWRAVALLLGLTLHEAAVLAHSVQEASQRALAWARRARAAAAWGWICHGYRRARAGLARRWEGWRRAPRCPKCQGRLPQARAGAEACDTCLALAVPALRMKAAQLEAQNAGLLVALGEAQQRAYDAELRRDKAGEAMGNLGAQLEALGWDLELMTSTRDAWKDIAQARTAARDQWRALFLRALALALHQHACAVRRKDSLKAVCTRLRWYRGELAAEQLRRAKAEAARGDTP
ncbi:hypothetical protein [Hyalangium minutum]|uniref:Uncharacterized protein n=1 Tax=Hyalangium minutum TaxID=394096 RepID=A0A085VXF6_9BACT|nr:hypothetical protein [Hyalangium minutum]KFE60119.1 hypothetical protein DB31_5990 [Hyalangium minutum]